MGRKRQWVFAALLAGATAVAPWHVEAAEDVPDAASVLAAARAAIVTTRTSPAAPEVWSGYDAQGRRVYVAAPWVEIGSEYRPDGSVVVADTRGTVRVDYPAAEGVSRHVYRTAEGVTRTVWRWHDSGGAGTRAEVVAPTLGEARAALAAAGIDEGLLRGDGWDPDLLDWDWSEGAPTVHDLFGNAWMSVDTTTAADGSWITSTTSAGGTQLTVTAQAGPEGWVFSDSLGHTQTVRYSEDGTPATIVDGHGEVLEVFRDADGRVTSVVAGGRLRVDYEYGPGGATWVGKRVTDVVTGEVVLELENSRVTGGRYVPGPDPIHVPREGEGEVLLPTMGAAAGWDPGLASSAYARATVGTRPYAVMLLDGSGAAYEAIWPVAGGGDDRIVFDERTVRLDLLDGMLETQRVFGPRVVRGGEAPNRVIIRLCPDPECFCIHHG